MKKINITFSIPTKIHDKLQSLVGENNMNAFASEALAKALEEKTLSLKQAYLEADKDPDRKKVIDDWSSLGI